jgi:hypothetical protein
MIGMGQGIDNAWAAGLSLLRCSVIKVRPLMDYLSISKLDTIWQTSNIGYFQEEGVK